jgi:peptidoglycan hydrolase CwlO-like protein
MNWASVLQIASGLGGLTVLLAIVSLPWTLKKLRSDTRKTDAEGVKFLTESAVAFLAPARAEIGELEKSLKAAKVRVNELEAEVQQLRNQVGEMSKELTELKHENHRLREGT